MGSDAEFKWADCSRGDIDSLGPVLTQLEFAMAFQPPAISRSIFGTCPQGLGFRLIKADHSAEGQWTKCQESSEEQESFRLRGPEKPMLC